MLSYFLELPTKSVKMLGPDAVVFAGIANQIRQIVTFSVPAAPGRSLPAALALKSDVFLKVFH